MPNIQTYRIIIKNVEGTTIICDITDTDTILFEGQNIDIIEMTGGENALVLSTINNADDPLQPILGAKLTVTFKNTSTENLNFFGSGEDNRFQIFVDAIGFKGFMVMDDNQEPYLPPGQEVILTFTDNLGLLRDIELSDSNGDKLRGRHKIIKYVYECLLKTGHDLEIYVMNNLFEVNNADRTADLKNCPWDQNYVNANLFTDGINEYVDCYKVLEETLFSWGCRLHQYMGAWWIMRVDEYKESNNLSSSLMYYTRYINGAVATGHQGIFEKTIDTDTPLVPVDRHVFGDAPLVTIQREFKSVKLELPYDTPEEIISNMNFERGDLNTPLSGVGYSAFDVDDWTAHKDFPPYTDPPTFTPYIKRVFDSNGYEQERYLVLSEPTTAAIQYMESQPVEVCLGGKFNFSVDYKWDTDKSGAGSLTVDVANIRLEGDDGSHYTLDDDGKWYLSNAGWTTNIKDLESSWIPDDVDEREWRTLSVEAAPIPVTGNIYIMLRAMNQDGGIATDNVQIHFSNLSLNYFHKVNGTYSPYKGESYKLTSPRDLSAKREGVLFMGDLPCKPYKRALFTFDGTNYNLTTSWLDWKLANASPAPVVDTSNRFAWWQTQAMWNQYRLGKRLFQGSWKGIDSGTSEPLWLLHRIKITSVSKHNMNRKFIWLSLEMDLRRCTYSGVLAEIDDTTDPRSYEEELEFKYLMSN